MLSIDGPRLAVAQELARKCPKTNVIGVLHALSDSREFVEHLLAAGHPVPHIFAKPFSKNRAVIDAMTGMGVQVHERPYSELEGSSILRDTIAEVRASSKGPLTILDVGGYFAEPLARMSRDEPALLPSGVLEVTTFGHNRYLRAAPDIKTPIVSVARSPLKDVEAVFVGESAWTSLDLILREAGLSVFGAKLGMVGYGMIGRRVVGAAKSGGAHTTVFDQDPIKLLDARSYKHRVVQELGSLLRENDIVIASTGGMAISVENILNHAKDSLILGSAGSRVQEIDIAGIERDMTSKRSIHENLTEYVLSNGKKIYILRGGTSINFLVGSCPDETMDIVFSEIVAGINMILTEELPRGVINEVSQNVRQRIARTWLGQRE